MKTILARVYRTISAITLALVLELTPLSLFLGTAHAANVPLAINGATRYQTMDGFGVNANSASWGVGQPGATSAALDQLVTENGSTLWRVVIDDTNWEAANDDSDPATFNWTYYNSIYSSAKFQNLWGMMSHLNAKGITSNLILNFMGRGPTWLTGSNDTLTAANEDEWVEMVSSVAYYARNTAHVQFGIFAPGNEPDWDCNEGICMSSTVYADAMNKLATKLNAIGLSDIRLMGPDVANQAGQISSYIQQMATYPGLLAKIDHFGMHNYDGNLPVEDNLVKTSAPGKNFWVDETQPIAAAFKQIGQGASAVMVWEGYDSVYQHAIDRGDPATPGDDAFIQNGALLSYDANTGLYGTRKQFYQYEQLFKYVPAGSVRVAATQAAGNVTTYAFTDPVSGRVTIVGYNAGASAVTFAGSLSNLATSVPSFEYYTTDSGSANFLRGADVPVTANAFTVTAPANGIFTLTYAGAPDTVAPSPAPVLSVTTATPGQANLSWTASGDNIGVTAYDVYRATTAGFTPAVANKITSIAGNATTYVDSVAAGTYYYKVQARDAAGNVSALSNEVAATVAADTTPPSVPTGVVATAISPNHIDLSWTASTDTSGVASYTIRRGGTVIGTSTTPTYSDTTVAASTTYSYTVSATDTAGNASAVSSPAASATTPATSALALRSSTTTHQTSPGSSIASGVFTAQPGDLLVAFISSDGPAAPSAITFNTPTTTGVTWTLRKRANTAGSGTAEIWTGVAPAGFSSGTVSATRSTGSYQGSITVASFSGADINAAPATGGASGTNSAPSTTVTTTRAGSWVWGVGNDWTNVGSRTAGANQTIVDQYLPAGIGAYWVQRQNGPTAAPGAVAINDTAPTTSDSWNLAAIEILPLATDTTPPSVPAGLATTSVAYNQVNLSWTASTDNVGVTGYNILRNGTQIGTSVAPAYSDTTVAASTAYQYTVVAKDAAGNASAASANLPVTTPAAPDTTAPTAPTGLTAAAASATQANLSWTASTDNLGVTGYNVYRGGTQIGTATGTTYSDTTAVANTTYQYTVKAKDAAGNVSAASNTATITMPAPPDTIAPSVAITAPAANSVVAGAKTVTATASDNVGVAGVQFKLDGANLGSEVTSAPYQATWDTTVGTNGTHTLTATARDAAGNTTTSTVTVTVFNDTQAPVIGITAPADGATVGGTTAVTTSFSDNAAVTKIEMYVDGTLADTVSSQNPLMLYTYNWNTLAAGNGSHTLAAKAYDAAGNVGTSTTVTVTVFNDTTAPAAPTDLTANSTSSNQVDLSWTASTDDIAVASYTVVRNGVAIATISGTSYSDTSVTAGTAYTYMVVAKDAAGNVSGASNTATVTPPDTTAPSQPTGLTAHATSLTDVHLSWAAATDNVGIASYTVYRDGTLVGTVGTAGFDDSGLTPGQIYVYSVVANDAAGNVSIISDAATVTMPVPDTTAPTVGITNPSDGATVGGTVAIAVTATDDIAVTGIELDLDGVQIATNATAPHSFNWNTLSVANGSHALTAKAYDAAGNVGTVTINVTVFNDTTAPTAPTGLAITTVTPVQVGLSWTASTDNVGVTGYNVYRGGVQIGTATGTTYTDTSVVASSSYQYTITAKDAAGNVSDPSGALQVNTPAPPDTTAPTAPTGLTATAASPTQVNLSWTASTDNVGIASYTVLREGVAIATVTGATSYGDTTAVASTTYHYTVKAKDAAGNVSGASNTATVTTPAPPDTTAPTVALTAPASGATLSGTINLTATASDNVGVVGVQFLVDGVATGVEDTTSPYSSALNTATLSNGSHTVAARARDAAGNITTTTAVTTTVNNAASVVTIDKQVSADQTTAGATIVSPAITNPQVGDLLVAFISSDGPGAPSAITFNTPVTTGLTWTLRKRTNPAGTGTSEIWTAVVPAGFTSGAVSAARSSGSYMGSITVVAFTGADTVNIGATASASGTNKAPSVSLTTTKAGSWVWAVGNDWTNVSARTAGANQTITHQYTKVNIGAFWTQQQNATTPTAGTSVTINDTAPTGSDLWNLSAIEILPKP